MDILNRFKPLMSQALHFSGSQAGLDTPLEHIQNVLRGLADVERALPYGDGNQDGGTVFSSFSWKENGEHCRFAVYAWIDELLLNAPRADANAWMGLSLQSVYFGTSAAGTRFFTDLGARLGRLLDGQKKEASLSFTTSAPTETGGLSASLAQAATMKLSDEESQVLRVYALCILYGFSGCYFDRPDELRALRKAAGTFLTASEEPLALLQKHKSRHFTPSLAGMEPVFYVLVPLLASLAFGLYCADILANLPLLNGLT